jgi:hypothetical protein
MKLSQVVLRGDETILLPKRNLNRSEGHQKNVHLPQVLHISIDGRNKLS